MAGLVKLLALRVLHVSVYNEIRLIIHLYNRIYLYRNQVRPFITSTSQASNLLQRMYVCLFFKTTKNMQKPPFSKSLSSLTTIILTLCQIDYSQCLPGTASVSSISSITQTITTVITATIPPSGTSTSPPTTVGSGSGPGTTLLSNYYWIRAVEAPNFQYVFCYFANEKKKIPRIVWIEISCHHVNHFNYLPLLQMR